MVVVDVVGEAEAVAGLAAVEGASVVVAAAAAAAAAAVATLY